MKTWDDRLARWRREARRYLEFSEVVQVKQPGTPDEDPVFVEAYRGTDPATGEIYEEPKAYVDWIHRRIERLGEIFDARRGSDPEFFEALDIVQMLINGEWSDRNELLEPALRTVRKRRAVITNRNRGLAANPEEIDRLAGLWAQYWRDIRKSSNNAHEWMAEQELGRTFNRRADKGSRDRISRIVKQHADRFPR